jgi:hypothetical protein
MRQSYLSKKTLLSCLITYSVCQLPQAFADQVILIGGGDNLNTTPAQIEQNIAWVQRILDQNSLSVSTFFTDGDQTSPDVFYQFTEDETEEFKEIDLYARALEPLARVYGEQHLNSLRTRSNNIENLTGSTVATDLSTSIAKILRENPDKSNLLVFNGRSKKNVNDDSQPSIALWNNTQMSVAELHSLLKNTTTPTRFVMTQCQSGSFHRLAYENPAHGMTLAQNKRCGFTASSVYSDSEVCSEFVNNSDYRDYSTYFFAALDGYDRDGEILPLDPDSNQDGKVTLREAHFYSMQEAHSIDLSRSSSEDFLQQWEPWFLKWTSANQNLPNNEYAKLFRTTADKHSVSLDNDTAKTIRNALNSLEQDIVSLQTQRDELEADIQQLQSKIITDASSRWPALLGPYTASYQSLAASGELLVISEWISKQPTYVSVLKSQQDATLLDETMLDNQRQQTQMRKLLHFRELANLKEQLYQYASNDDIQSYESLVSCEDTPLKISER